MLLEQLSADVIVSMKSGDKNRTETLRFLIAAIKKFQIDTYLPGSTGKLTDEDVLKIIKKQIKTHDESIVAFEKGGRADLVAKEKSELAILKTYVPSEMADDEIKAIVRSVIGSGTTEFGPLMGAVMKQIAGRAGGDRVQKILREELQK